MSNSINIHSVGHHLQTEAVSAAPDKQDAYARSAFNRYYYSAYLNTRALLASLDPAWSSLPHASYPEVLRGKVKRKLNREREKARKNSDVTLVARIDAAKRAVNELAKIMTIAYAVRVVADYEPDEHVSFGGSLRFSLRSVDVSDAHEWENGTRVLCTNVGKVWDEIYG